MSLRDRLDRLLGPAPAAPDETRARIESAMRGARKPAALHELIPGEDLGRGAWLVRRTHDLPSEFSAALPSAWAGLAREPAFSSARHDSLAFLDLETTGLAGGTGTLAFLIGLALIKDGRLETRQYFLESHAAESTALSHVESDLAAATHLVTFNGKCFDVPLLETRFIMNRRKLAPRPHLDLLFPARRIWKRRLDSCTLSRLEGEVLGRPRHGDIDGAEIPQRYFDWLALKDARPLVPVVEHNRQDLVALAALAGRLARLVEKPAEATHALDLFSIGVMFAKEGDARAEEALDSALSRGATGAAAELARVRKKAGRAEEALPLWELAAREPGRKGLEAGVELAKHYEHKAKSPILAERLTRELLCRSDLTPREQKDLERRLSRLESKVSRLILSRP